MLSLGAEVEGNKNSQDTADRRTFVTDSKRFPRKLAYDRNLFGEPSQPEPRASNENNERRNANNETRLYSTTASEWPFAVGRINSWL